MALFVRRGVQRLFFSMGIATLAEMTLAHGRRADLVGITSSGEIWIVEIKSSLTDLKADGKWPDYRGYCDRLFFASHAGVAMALFPDECGFILADNHGGHIVRDAPEHHLSPQRRKAMMLKLARSAANRLTHAELEGLVTSKDDIIDIDSD